MGEISFMTHDSSVSLNPKTTQSYLIYPIVDKKERPMKLIVLILSTLLISQTTVAGPRDVFKIEIGKNYDSYSNNELRRRVWELERAVRQLQDQVFHLSMNQGRPGHGGNQWTCMIQSFGKTFTSTRSTKSAATAKVLKDCSANSNAIHCDAKNVSCDNE